MSNSTKPATRLRSGHDRIDRMYDLAVDTLFMNIRPFADGLLDEPAPCIMAGESYQTPWTRDCAYNVWNAGALLAPEASHNTLLSTLFEDDDGLVRVGGQYWDAISWAIGAWAYCATTGDEGFLPLAHAATFNSLRFFEETEFDPETGLFEGPASYGDGVAAYPAPYDDAGGSSGILDWPAAHPEVGKNRMKALSTNCLYVRAYEIAALMGDRIGIAYEQRDDCLRRAASLRNAINLHLWLPERGRYAYFIDHEGRCEEYMEGLGHALAILTCVADGEKAEAILKNQHVTGYGIPCVWPLFPRFQSDSGMEFGRHCGTVWPFIQGFWAEAACRCAENEDHTHPAVGVFENELLALAEMADRTQDFKEIYHPITGEEYGGWQIDHGKQRLWRSEPNQTWSATGYLRMIHAGLCGMRIEPGAIHFAPVVPERFDTIELGPIGYRDMTLHITVKGSGARIARFAVNGQAADSPVVDASRTGEQVIEIEMR